MKCISFDRHSLQLPGKCQMIHESLRNKVTECNVNKNLNHYLICEPVFCLSHVR